MVLTTVPGVLALSGAITAQCSGLVTLLYQSSMYAWQTKIALRPLTLRPLGALRQSQRGHPETLQCSKTRVADAVAYSIGPKAGGSRFSS